MSRYNEGGYFRPYVPVAERRRRAAKKVASMKKAGRTVSPVAITGHKIATTFWGEAWCQNLEAYSDYASRLPRGRTYVRNGSVLDLQIEAGRVRTLVSGTELYEVEIAIKSLAKKRWTDIKGRCSGQIDSLVELLQGSISEGVMEIVTCKREGIFPSPQEITLNCSCPDWAAMCKHVAATLYGVGARLDHEPELLFTLRGVDPAEMVESAIDQPARSGKVLRGRVLETDQLSSVFGVDIDTTTTKKTRTSVGANESARRKTSGKKTTTKKKGPLTKKPETSKKSAGKKSKAKTSASKKSKAKTSGSKKSTTTRGAPKKTPTRSAATRATAGKTRTRP